jgi:hypothetical protein
VLVWLDQYPFPTGRGRQDVISDGSLFYTMYDKDYSLSG